MEERSIITDALVVKLTQKPMEHWFLMLDGLGARSLKHADIFQMVSNIKGLEPLGQWNQNLLTTTYEWNRGLKQRGEKANGFEIGVSKTITVPVSMLYQAWIDDTLRKRWLTEPFEIRKATPDKSLRITWNNGTSLSVEFYVKGEQKSQVVVQHLKIPDAAQAAHRKQYWSERLDALKALLA